MKGFTLTQEKLQELRAAHKSAKQNRDASSAYRINAIILLGSGWTLQEVSSALLLDEETLRTYVNQYKLAGFQALLKRNYQGSNPKLTDEQFSELQEELNGKVYLNTKAICYFVKDKFDINYSISGMTDLLHRLGYVYKKPKLVPANPDKEAQEIFIQHYLGFIENKPKNDVIVFADAVHPVHNSMPAYGWIKKGTTQELKSNTGRSRLNIHGAMNAETYETTIIYSEEPVNSESTIALLQQLETVYYFSETIHVIFDNAKYHYSKEVQKYIKNSRINLVFLPAYSPELNLIERLWKVFKKNVMYNRFYEKFSEFKESCIDFFRNQGKYEGEIISIMGDGLEALI